MTITVNRELLKFKILYFCELSIVSGLFIYIPKFMVDWGITPSELAIINFFENVFAFLARPLFGYLVDRTQRYREIFMVITIFCGLSFMLFPSVPKHTDNFKNNYVFNQKYNLYSEINSTKLTICNNETTYNCWPNLLKDCLINGSSSNSYTFKLSNKSATCGYYTANMPFISNTNINCQLIDKKCIINCVTTPFIIKSENNSKFTFSLTFWLIGLLKIIGFSLYSPMLSITDSIIFVTLGPEKAKEYGFNRMFGTIGVLVMSGISAMVLFIMCHLTATGQYPNVIIIQAFSQFTVPFILTFFLFVITVIIAATLKNDKRLRCPSILKKDSTFCRNFIDVTSLDLLFQNVEVGVFFIFSMLSGVMMTIMVQYYFMIIYDMFPNLPKYFPGIVSAIMTISESIFFGISGKLLNIMRYEFWISVSFFSWSLRFFLYLFVSNYWWMIVIELLHGPAFGLALACLSGHISKFASKTSMGRTQGLFSGIFFNIGGAIGGLLGGLLLSQYGYRGIFVFIAVLGLVCGITYYPLQVFITKRFVTKIPVEISIKNDNQELTDKEETGNDLNQDKGDTDSDDDSNKKCLVADTNSDEANAIKA